MGTQLKNIFDKEMAGCNDVMKMAAMLANPDICQMAVDAVSFNEGYLPGFDADVTGFKSCAGAVPMISTIPFVAYVFEADNPESFLETIKGLANPRWNICTEAAETVYSISGNFVFFAMCPGGEDW